MRLRKIFLLLMIAGSGVTAQDTESASVSFAVTITNVAGIGQYRNTGVAGISQPEAQVLPGGSVEFTVTAAPGESLSFVTALAQSNDLFFAPDVNGIALYDGDASPVNGDVTGQAGLWVTGTGLNQPVGDGQQTARQPAPGSGDNGKGVVRRVDGMAGYPAVADILSIHISGDTAGIFTVSIDNVSDLSTTPAALSPVVWVVTSPRESENGTIPGVFFTPEEPERGNGLEALAEDGNSRPLAAVLAGSDMVMPLLPVVWVVHEAMQDDGIFFTPGSPDRGQGLEALAEDGSVPGLTGLLAGMDYPAWGVASIPDMEPGPGTLVPGNFYTILFEAKPGENLSFVTRLVESNDLFFAPDPNGIPLFDSSGQPIRGDITRYIRLWDAGTEVNEAPGRGMSQSPRQPAPNSGESGVVRRVEDPDSYPPVAAMMRVTIDTGY